jgi:hypothetical protein
MPFDANAVIMGNRGQTNTVMTPTSSTTRSKAILLTVFFFIIKSCYFNRSIPPAAIL